MGSLTNDLRFAIRVLWKSRGSTGVALFALVLGIGANSAIFSVINAVFLKELPFRDPSRLAMVWERSPRTKARNVANPQNVADWQSRNHSFEAIAAFIDTNINLGGDAGRGPEQLDGAYVSRDFFKVLGVSPMLGRDFEATDESTGRNDTVLLSYSLWQRRFGGDRAIVGKQIPMVDHSGTVIGVMPPGFRFPGSKAQMWDLLALRAGATRRGRFLTPIGRLRQGVSIEKAQADMDMIARQLAAEYPSFDTDWGITVISMREQFVGDLRTPLLVLLGAVGMVLLIACANVANLMLMRSSGRQREMAIRASLGATRSRVVQQLLIESAVLAFAAAVLGLGVALWAKDALLAMLPDDMSVAQVNSVTIDARVLLFTFAVALGTALLFGLLPALRSSRSDVSETLKEGGRGVYGSLRKNRVRATLVASEIAIALTLLIGSGLLIKSFVRLADVPPGFNPEHVLTMRIVLAEPEGSKASRAQAMLNDMLGRIQALPGVMHVGAIHFLPLTSLRSATSFWVDGEPVPKPGAEPVTDVSIVTPGYFPAMSVALRKGRLLNDSDVEGRPQVTVISEALARQFFPKVDPIGQRLMVGWGRKTPYEIVGVVADVKHEGLNKAALPAVYFPYAQEPMNLANVVIRTGASPLSIARAAQDQIHAVDPNQAIGQVQTMDEVMSRSLTRPRFQSVLLGAFAGLALLLATIGIFGVISYSVAQRTREIGVRMALGAERRTVIRLVVGQAMIIAISGAGAGVVAAFALTRYLRTLLFEVTATDPVTFTILPVMVCLIAAAASYLPARRAASVDPLSALRYE